jgi:mevalonate kinase
VGELCTHGDPSGIDNTVSASGKAVVYQRNGANAPTVTPLAQFPKLPLLLVDTQQARSTATQVEKVRDLRTNHGQLTESILTGIGQLTASALELITTPGFDSQDGISRTLEHLGTLIRVNHGFLVSLGVSHPRLERIRELVDYTDIGWTKLTGAGGGGCAITLFKPGVQDGIVQDLERDLTAEGFRIHETVLGADGVGVLWPAVFRAEGEESQEIDQEKFENAPGTKGIEELVGLGVRENREGWKFWTRHI